MPETPACVARSETCREAFEFAFAAHEGAASTGKTGIDHPIAVTELLDEAGFADEVLVAALLHDVVEDTERALAEIGARFGPAVCGLVEAMTEDAGIEPYEARKDEHRRRVVAAGHDPAAIYAADKLARVRALRRAGEPVDPRRLAHYRATLELFRSERPELPFLDRLAEELPALEAAGPED